MREPLASNQVEYKGRVYTIKTHTVGVHFATRATLTIGRKTIKSRLCPYDFTGAAIESCMSNFEKWKAER